MDKEWRPIRCVEDNPKESGEYLVTVKCFDYDPVLNKPVRYNKTTLMQFTVDEFGASWNRTPPWPPIAWMPMPAPYRPEGEEKC